MKRYVPLMVIVVFFAIAPSVFGQALPPGEICNQNGNFGVDHDTCVTCATVILKDSNAGAVCFCKIFQDLGLIPNAQVKNFGQCVSQVRHGALGPTNLSIVTLSTLLMGWAAIQLFRRRRSVLNA